MIEIEFTEEDIKESEYQRYHHPHPQVQQRMEVLVLKAHGLPHQQITQCAGVSENTLRSYDSSNSAHKRQFPIFLAFVGVIFVL